VWIIPRSRAADRQRSVPKKEFEVMTRIAAILVLISGCAGASRLCVADDKAGNRKDGPLIVRYVEAKGAPAVSLRKLDGAELVAGTVRLTAADREVKIVARDKAVEVSSNDLVIRAAEIQLQSATAPLRLEAQGPAQIITAPAK
jgi:hypothetical protein